MGTFNERCGCTSIIALEAKVVSEDPDGDETVFEAVEVLVGQGMVVHCPEHPGCYLPAPEMKLDLALGSR